MNGNHIWIGSGDYYNLHLDDVFFAYPITETNSSQIKGFGTTLNLKSNDTGLITFQYQNPAGYNIQEQITYDTKTHIITDYYNNYDSYGSGSALVVKTPAYSNNASLKNYLPKIAGTRLLSGIVNDTLYVRYPIDSIYTVTANITFTIADDLTIKCNADFLGIQDSALHYKGTDNSANTVTFQTFHDAEKLSSTTVTYNYVTNSLIFEQKVVDIATSIHLKLQ